MVLMSKRAGTWLSVVIGAAPFWFLCDFYLFWLLSYVHLGAWPRQYVADPKDLPFGYYYERLAICIFVWPLFVVGPIAGLILLKLSGGKVWLGLLTLVASSVLFYFLWSNDPGGCIEWFFD